MLHGGNSRSARKRRKRTAILSQAMRDGDPDAAFRLLQRRRALQGIAKRGYRWRLVLANAARLGNREQRVAAVPLAAEQRRVQAECTVVAKALEALRARYGSAGSTIYTFPCPRCHSRARGGICEFHRGELFPRVGFIVTNLGTSSRALVRFYNKRGTAEQWIKESKQAVALTRLDRRGQASLCRQSAGS
jgi:Transposase DDE domain group 1